MKPSNKHDAKTLPCFYMIPFLDRSMNAILQSDHLVSIRVYFKCGMVCKSLTRFREKG